MKKLSALKMLLDERNITYKELARDLGISTVTLAYKINGKPKKTGGNYSFTLEESNKILDILGIYKSEEKCRLFNL